MASRRNTLPIQGLYDMKDSVIISQKNKMQTLNNNVSDCTSFFSTKKVILTDNLYLLISISQLHMEAEPSDVHA